MVSEIFSFLKINSTFLLAIYGAILSTIIVTLKIYDSLKNKAKIKVIAKFGFVDFNSKLSENLLIITATNKGRRPITLSSVGIKMTNNQNLINIHPFNLPFELKEEKSHSEWFEVSKLKNKNCKFAWYVSGTGKVYKSKNIEKKLKKYFDSENKKN